MSEEIRDQMRKMIERLIGGSKKDEVVVARIKPEHQAKYRDFCSKRRKTILEGKRLEAKINVLKSQLDAMDIDFWDWVYEACHLPPELHYRDNGRGTIYKIIEKEREN